MYKIKAEDGRMIIEREEAQSRWKENVEDLYDRSNRPEKLTQGDESEVEEDILGPGILQLDAEIKRAFRDMKAGKAVGDF